MKSSTKYRGSVENRTSETTDTEELQRGEKCHFWQAHLRCHCRAGRNDREPTAMTPRSKKYRGSKARTRQSAEKRVRRRRGRQRGWSEPRESQTGEGVRKSDRKLDGLRTSAGAAKNKKNITGRVKNRRNAKVCQCLIMIA